MKKLLRFVEKKSTNSKSHLQVKNIALILVIGIFSFVASEFGTRIIWKIKYNKHLENCLRGYDYVDYKRSILLPIPNTLKTYDEHKADLKNHGKLLGLQNLENNSDENEKEDIKEILRINKHGFKGPEFEIPKPDSVFRIIAIGDSCTWGGDFGNTYPRVMEKEINSRIKEGFSVEVINGSFMGYNIEEATKRVDDFLSVEPDVVTIYLGWNRTIQRADPKKNNYLYHKLHLYKIFYHLLVNRKSTGLQIDFPEKTYFSLAEPEIKGFESWSFKHDINDLDKLIKIIRKRNRNIKIVLYTLAGLFDTSIQPDNLALKIGHPIVSTNNLYAFPVLTKNWNTALREYATAEEIPLIDFEKAAYDLFPDRSNFFTDSIHPTPEGYRIMGKYFSGEIIKILEFNESRIAQ